MPDPSGLIPDLSLGVKPPQVSGGLSIGDLGGLAQALNSFNQNRLFQQTFQARQDVGRALATADPSDPEAAVKAVLPYAGLVPDVFTAIKSGQQAQTVMQGEQQKQYGDALTGFMSSLPALKADPSLWSTITQSALVGVPPGPVRERLQQGMESVRLGLTNGLDKLPLDQQATGFSNRLTGLLYAGMGEKANNILNPNGSLQMGVKPSVGYQPLGPAGTPTPILTTGQGVTPLVGAGAVGTAPTGGGAAPGGVILPGGVPSTGPTQQQAEYNTARTKDISDYEKNLEDRVTTGQTFYRNMSEIQNAAKEAQTGGGAETFMKLGQALQAFGVDNATVDKMANGSLAASQVIDKASLTNTMNQLKQQLTGVGGSRINQAEFSNYLSKNPGILTDPRAVNEVFNLWNDFYNRDTHELQALDQYKTNGGDLSRWPATWAKSDYMQKFAPGTPFTGVGVKGIPQAGRQPLTDIFGPIKASP